MRLSNSPVLSRFLVKASLIILLPLQACVSEDQPSAQEAVIVANEAETSSLPPEEAEASELIAAPELSQDTSVQEIPAEASDLSRINFETARWALDEAALSQLRELASRMTNESTIKLSIEGHCDERGTDTYNQELSLKRARAVRKALVNLGISPARLTTAGFGRSRPLVEGTSDEDRAQNRRVELVLKTTH